MNTLHLALGVACLAASTFSQGAASDQATSADRAMGQISRSAEQELAQSIQELDRLREQIAADKLPLAEELTASEEKLSRLRHEHEKITRLIDAGNLEIPAIKGEMKARQDELAYIGNLLDEYARTFESKVNVSELQYCGEAIQTAKQATEDPGLSPSDKFGRQLAFADISVKRLFDVVGGLRFPGVAVDLQGAVIAGQFAIIGPVALFSAKQGGVAGLVIPQSGSTNPLVRPLEGALQAGIAALVDTGEGAVPVDPSLGGALKALVQKTSLKHIFDKGGPIMWPLLLASILALATVIERVVFLMREKIRRDPKALAAFFAAVGRGDTEGAILVSKASKFHVVRALGYALTHKEGSLGNALLYAQALEMKRFRRGIPVLDTVITLAPLLGLLGTVTGMMGSFSLIGGELSSPGAITGGIAEALIATAFGLGIAITALLPFNFLNARMEEARHELESAAAQLELMVQQQAPSTMVVRAAKPPPWTANDADERARAAAAQDEARRKQRELQRKRLEIQRQIAELQTELQESDADGDVLIPHERRVNE